MEFNADKYKIFDGILKNPNYQNDEIIEVIGKALSVCCPFTWERINKILLNIINFNEEELKNECYKGLPDDLPSLRAIIWKINFRYLPHDILKWKESLESKRKEYLEIKNAFILRIQEEIKIFEELEKEKKNKENNLNIKNESNNTNNNKDENEKEKIENDINNKNGNNIENIENKDEKENNIKEKNENENKDNISKENKDENNKENTTKENNSENLDDNKEKNENNLNEDKINIKKEIENNNKKNNNDNDNENKNGIDNNNIKSLSSLAECTDRTLLEMINKDINRTHINMNFFTSVVNKKNKISNEELNKIIAHKRNCTYQDYKLVYTKGRDKKQIFENETHSDVIERIIYIYSKLNKQVGYVQGMNELIAPIYYCFSIDNTVSLENVEADTFWCFTFMMKDIKKLFLKENDNLKGGILDRVFTLDLIVSHLQKDIYKILNKNNVNIFHFAFSWINVFFCQEFVMPDLIRLWDIIFSEQDRFGFIYFFSMAILQIKKKKIEKKEFSSIISEIRNLENENIEELIELAIYFKKKYDKKVKEIILQNNKKETGKNEILIKSQKSLSKVK